MSDPGHPLQVAVFAALTGSTAVTNFVAQGIFDRVRTTDAMAADFPYITIPDDQIIDDGNTCGEAWEAFVDVHVWGRDGGAAKTKQIGDAVADALGTEIAVAGHTVVSGTLETARNVTDPDGITAHRVLTFRYLLQPVE